MKIEKRLEGRTHLGLRSRGVHFSIRVGFIAPRRSRIDTR